MAGLKIGVYKSLNEIEKQWRLDKKFLPKVNKNFRKKVLKGWNNAVKRTLIRVDIVPASLALSQAAMEYAWGTSRFALEGNNLFGQWCYQAGCSIVPARRSEGQVHEVASFTSIAAAVASDWVPMRCVWLIAGCDLSGQQVAGYTWSVA